MLIPLQARTSFPRWPIETALHDLYDWLFRLIGMIAVLAGPVLLVTAISLLLAVAQWLRQR